MVGKKIPFAQISMWKACLKSKLDSTFERGKVPRFGSKQILTLFINILPLIIEISITKALIGIPAGSREKAASGGFLV